MPPGYLSTSEAAAAVGLSPYAIKAAIKRGELAAFLPGGRNPRHPGRGISYQIAEDDLWTWYRGGREAGREAGREGAR